MNDSLMEAARRAREKAYAPYSKYLVGAAVLDAQGAVWMGCNVENISYALAICAERTALCKMVSEGSREVRAIAVSTRDGGTPCGMCLQMLLEFSPDPSRVEVFTIADSGQTERYLLSELIPHGFTTNDLKRT